MTNANAQSLMARLEALGAPELRRLLVEHLTKRKLGLNWESDAIARDVALNADVVLPRQVAEWSHRPEDMAAEAPHRKLIIEGDNFDALRLLKSTHAGRVRVIYIDPPYNTGNKDCEASSIGINPTPAGGRSRARAPLHRACAPHRNSGSRLRRSTRVRAAGRLRRAGAGTHRGRATPTRVP